MDHHHKIRYCALDYSHVSKHRNFNVSKALDEAATWAVNKTGFFCSKPKWKIRDDGEVVDFWAGVDPDGKSDHVQYFVGVPVMTMEQKGVLRTNCIDCLDRTNVAQFSAGVSALSQQLVVMGIHNSADLEPSSQVVHVLMDMYSEIGDQIALQYGGSEAHKKVASTGPTTVQMGKHKEFLTSIRRYYSNTFTDRLKQDAMNLFLGNFIPLDNATHLWELENDYYLHNFHTQAGSNPSLMLSSKNRGAENAAADKGDSDLVNANNPAHNEKPGEADANGADETERKLKSEQAKIDRKMRVKRNCAVQSEKLSSWWKIALQKNLQRRMWMQLSQSQEIASKRQFDKLYSPQELTQFDIHFSHSWATPSRRANGFVDRSKSPTFDMAATISSGMSVIGGGASRAAGWAPTGSVAGSAEAGSYSAVEVSEASSPRGGSPRARDLLGGGRKAVDKNQPLSANSVPPVMGSDSSAFATIAGQLKHQKSPSAIADVENSRYGTSEIIGKQQPDASADASIKYYNYMRRISTKAKSMLSLKSFNSYSERYEYGDPIISNASNAKGDLENGEAEDYAFFGQPSNLDAGSVQEYSQFVAYAQHPELLADSFKEQSFLEFTANLAESTLSSDDVEGITNLVSSAHITREINSGPYKGLPQEYSSLAIATLFHEQLNIMCSAAERGDEEDGRYLVEKNLERKGIKSEALKQAIYDNWEDLKKGNDVNRQLLGINGLKVMRSDLSTSESLKLYCSYFDEENVMEDKELEYMLSEGGSVGEARNAAAKQMSASETRASEWNGTSKVYVREGFEQINDDLFSRRANKFMVFNGVGMEDWTVKPRTRISANDGNYEKSIFARVGLDGTFSEEPK